VAFGIVEPARLLLVSTEHRQNGQPLVVTDVPLAEDPFEEVAAGRLLLPVAAVQQGERLDAALLDPVEGLRSGKAGLEVDPGLFVPVG
jgi:hypothetical protein